MEKRKKSKEEQERELQMRQAKKDLTLACEPEYHRLMADDERHDRDAVARAIDVFIDKDVALQKLRNAMAAYSVTDRIIEKTSTRHFIDDRQSLVFASADEIREFLNHATFECGDGQVIRASAVTYADLEREQARKEKNRDAVIQACVDSAEKLTRLRPLMVEKGMSRVDAEIEIWRDLKKREKEALEEKAQQQEPEIEQ